MGRSSGGTLCRVPSLDGLRGVACAFVVAQHLAVFKVLNPGFKVTAVSDHPAIDRVLTDLGTSLFAQIGLTGVDLFFVLSGFLITRILLTARGEAGAVKRFFARRTLRIFPLYYVVLITIFILWHYGAVPMQAGDADFNPIHFLTYTQNFVLAIDGWDAMPFALGHFWTLAVEEQFYLIWPFLVLFLPRRALVAVTASMLALALVFRLLWLESGLPDTGALALLPARMDTLCIGALVALAEQAGLLERLRRPAIVTVAISAAILALMLVNGRVSQEDPLMLTWGATVTLVLCGAIVLLCAVTTHRGQHVPFLESSILRSAGKYSYGTYVVQQPAILWMNEHQLRTKEMFEWLGGSYTLVWIIHLVVCTVFVFALGWLVYWLVEKPFLNLKVRFEG